MKRLFLSAFALCALVQSYSQTATTDSSVYRNKKLKLDEINLLSSYYRQDGNNSAVTGGVGTEELMDASMVIEVKLIRYDKHNRKQTLGIEAGADYYTSASSDLIDFKANSSASHEDLRVYPSVSYTIEDEKKGKTISAGVSTSFEADYRSFGIFASYSKKTTDKNGEFTARLQAYLDQLELIPPIEFRTDPDQDDFPHTGRNTFAGSLGYSQVVNDHFQVTLLGDLIYQKGYLSLPFHRVYLENGETRQENLPNNRTKIPIGIRGSYFLGDKIILRGYYRFYTDDWGLKSHTANLEIPVKISPFFSISPFYRFYTQTAARYFAPYQKHTSREQYYASNYDLSKFNSNFFGAGLKFTPVHGVFNMKHFNTVEIRYGHYSKNINMNADVVSLAVKWK